MTGAGNTMRAAGAAILLAGLGGPAFAHPGRDEGDGSPKKVIIVTEHRDVDGKVEARSGRGPVEIVRIERRSPGAGPPPQVRAFRMGPDGAPGCDVKDVLVDETAGDEKQKTKVIICGNTASPAQNVEVLERALARLRDNDNMSAEHKAKIEAAIAAAIDRARAGD